MTPAVPLAPHVPLLVLYHLSLAALLFSCFCRVAVTDKTNTRRVIRWGFSWLGVFALACLIAPWLWGFAPTWPVTGLITAMAAVQISTAKYWRHGVPLDFHIGKHPREVERP